MLTARVAPFPPVTDKVLTEGELQVYLVLAGTMPFSKLAGLTSNGYPLHTVVLIALITAFGFTNITAEKVAPTQFNPPLL